MNLAQYTEDLHLFNGKLVIIRAIDFTGGLTMKIAIAQQKLKNQIPQMVVAFILVRGEVVFHTCQILFSNFLGIFKKWALRCEDLVLDCGRRSWMECCGGASRYRTYTGTCFSFPSIIWKNKPKLKIHWITARKLFCYLSISGIHFMDFFIKLLS